MKSRSLVLLLTLILAAILNGCSKKDSSYPLEFSQVSYVKTEKLDMDSINSIIEEKAIDEEHSAFIYTCGDDSEYKGGINLNGETYYIGQVSMENTPDDLAGIEQTQVFGKKALKIYGILGAYYAQAFYFFADEEAEESVIQVDGHTTEIDLDDDDRKEIVSTWGTIPETKIYLLMEGKICVSDVNGSIGAKSVILQDPVNKIFEVCFEPNKQEEYVFYNDSLVKNSSAN